MAAKNILKVLFIHVRDLSVLGRMAKIDMAHGLKPDALLRLVLVAKAPLALRDNLRLTNAEVRRLEAIANHVQPKPELRERERRVVLYQLGAETWRDMVRLGWAESKDPLSSRKWRELLAFADRWPIPRFPLTGQDLIAQGFKPGPVLGRELARLEDWWIASDFQDGKDSLLRKLERGNEE